MHVLITGGTGHLGANLAREALADGHTVRVLARPTSSRAGIEGLDVEVAVGDLLDPASLRASMEGIDLVFNAAAVYRNWAPDDDLILRPAIEGTENVLRAAADAGVKRVVHTSSNAAVGFPPNREPWDETHFMTGAHSAYIRAKCESERIALELGADLGVEVVVVNPCGILGPWDFKPTPSTKSVVDLTTGGPAVLDVALTHVADIARGHLLAAERGRPGERYLLAGENLTREQLATLMTELTGRKVKALLPPRVLMRLIAWMEVRKARKSGGDAGITADQIDDVYGCSLFYDSRKAQTELGWTARPPRETLLDTLSWLAARGALADPVRAHVTDLRAPDAAWPVA